MVAKVTGHDWDYILKKMPFARGLQARTMFWKMYGGEIKGIEVEPINLVVSPLDTVIQ